jgi:ParB/RepB/Spo0J family partition protein
MNPTFTQAPLGLIVTSLTNPRKTFDPARLDELTASIKASGVHQPVLLRPLPASRLADTAGMKPRPEYELVAGERRYRASKAAGLQAIPAMVRELTDDQVLEIQIVENLQRDDLSELEEAEGYEALMQHSNLNADQVGAKIGKSRSYVYGRIKLLDLCQEARTSLRDGTVDASRALVVARIPDHKLQIKAMNAIVQGEGYGADREPMTYRQALNHVQRNYMLKLSDAKFKINCVDLVPDAGGCMSCAKRTGHDPDLFSDVKGADICTDPPCFHKKTEAHTAALVAEAKAKGHTVIAGREAAELRGDGYTDKFKGYRRLDNAEDSPTDQPLRKIIGKLMQSEGITPTMIAHPRKEGELVACLPNEMALKLLKMAEAQSKDSPKVSKEVQQLVDDKNAKAEEKAKARFEQGWRDLLVKDTWHAVKAESRTTFSTDIHRYLVTRAAKSLSTDNAEAICKVLDLGKVSPHSALIDYAKETERPDQLHMLIIMQESSGAGAHSYNGMANEGLMLIARNVWGTALDEVMQGIKLDVKAQVWPEKPQKAPTPTAPAAQAKGGGGGGKKSTPPLRAPAPKMRAEAAMQGIAAALQGDETPDAARRSGDITGACAQGNDVGPASRPDGAADAVAVEHAAADENTGPGVQAGAPIAAPAPHQAQVVNQAPRATVKGAKTAKPAANVKRSDALLEDAVELVTTQQAVSVRQIKTELGVGTARAMKIIDELERDGVVSATDERGARKVLVEA